MVVPSVVAALVELRLLLPPELPPLPPLPPVVVALHPLGKDVLSSLSSFIKFFSSFLELHRVIEFIELLSY